MAGMAVDGLVSGLSTTDLINQLVSAEGAGQRALQTRLKSSESAASAYRTVNTTFLAISAAAGKLTPEAVAGARTASSSSATVTATTTAAATPGSSITFTVTGVAATHVETSASTWTSAAAPARDAEPAWPIEVYKLDGTLVGAIDIPAGATLTEAAQAITDAGKGVTASVVRLGTDKYALQLTSTTPGAAGSFYVKSQSETVDTAGSAFLTTSLGKDASIDLGGGVTASSPTNTFTDLMPGLSVTVSKADPAMPVTVSVGSDDQSVATNVKTLVDAVNAAITTVKTYSSNAAGSTAALRGDYSLTSLTGRLLQAVSDAVGSSGSPAQVGIQLTRDGQIAFDKDKFLTALKEKPELAQALVLGTAESTAADGTTIPAVPGVAGRLLQVAKAASDAATGSLVSLATGQDSIARDLRQRIDAWDLRLEKRRETLTRQFTAMETALSSLKNQSTWLAGQLSALG